MGHSSHLLEVVAANKTLLALSAPILLYLVKRWISTLKPRRQSVIPCKSERVLIIGASSGVGKTLALQYSKRGSLVAIVGRRAPELDAVALECRDMPGQPTVLKFVADFGNAGQMVTVRSKLVEEWGGVDTIHVCAGVSALRPLLEVAGSQTTSKEDIDEEAISNTVSIARKAVHGNYEGPMVVALTFIPLLSKSAAPALVLLNTLASLIPAPTRTVYASTKSASLLLYMALSIEQPAVQFSFVIPSTIEGDFRSGAVDGGPVREADPNKGSLKKVDVAKACIRAADRGEKFVWMPWSMRYGHLLYWVWPTLVEGLARKKYNFPA